VAIPGPTSLNPETVFAYVGKPCSTVGPWKGVLVSLLPLFVGCNLVNKPPQVFHACSCFLNKKPYLNN
jgi:hypothetical protein